MTCCCHPPTVDGTASACTPFSGEAIVNTPNYIPALRFRTLTRLYDPIVALTTRERTFKTALLRQAQISAGMQVLDLGCGTGTLAIQLARTDDRVQVVGVDGDSEVLRLAADKVEAAGVGVTLQQGLSHRIPAADAQFDRVLSSLFFHHLDDRMKQATLAEIHRVLKPGGELHVADWGRSQNPLMRTAFLGIQLLDGFQTTASNVAGRLPGWMSDQGFADVRENQRFSTLFGTLSLYRATKSR